MSTPEDLISQFGDAVKLADVQTEGVLSYTFNAFPLTKYLIVARLLQH